MDEMREQIKKIIKDSHIFVEGQYDTDVFVAVPLNELTTAIEQYHKQALIKHLEELRFPDYQMKTTEQLNLRIDQKINSIRKTEKTGGEK